jgi:hypothetical protein
MSCPLCVSDHLAELPVEMMIHFTGLKNIDRQGVLLFPKLLVCLDCGFSRFTTPETELASLATGGALPSAIAIRLARGSHALLRRGYEDSPTMPSWMANNMSVVAEVFRRIQVHPTGKPHQ